MLESTTRCCLRCGESLPAAKRRDARFCDECRKLNARDRASAWYAAHKHEPRVKEIRRKAKQKHYAKVSADPDLLAERLASTAKWRDANRERMAAQYRAWFDDNVERVRQKTRRRRARLLAAFIEDVDLAVLLERDAGVCGICTEPIDLALRWPDRGSLTLDHVIPLSRGGTHEYANTQIAHAVCNSRKNDRPALQ